MTSAVLQLQGNPAGEIDDDNNNNNNNNNNSNDNRYQGTLVVPHGSVPVNEYHNPSLWLSCYPWIFPYGRGGPEEKRTPQVGLRAYVKHVLQLADRRFSLDPSFKFHAFNVIQKRDVSYHSSLIVSRPGFSSTAASIDSLNQESMTELLKCIENKTPITDPNLKSLMKTLSSAGKHINGSPHQKSTYRREIYGLMIELGCPVLWITISPAPTHSPIFLQIAGHTVDLNNIPSHVERAIEVANDPVAAALYFNKVIDAFTTFILGYKQLDGGVFGHPSAYYGMTEEQGTGTLHNHMLVWLHNFKSTSKLKEELADATFKKNLTDYLERVIKQGYLGAVDEKEDEEIDKNLQDLDVTEVSFKYPVAVNDPSFVDDINKLVRIANTHKCRATCHKYRKTADCRFEFPRELVNETQIETDNFRIKRTNEMINNFNPIIMTCIRCNHDVKFVPSGKDGKNIAFYVTNYATKSQLSTNNMVPLIAASKKRLDEDPSFASSDRNSRARAMITKCLNQITTHTEVSGSHVSHFLLGHKDCKTSHKFTSLNLHSAWAWLINAIKEYDNLGDNLGDNTLDAAENENQETSNPVHVFNNDDGDNSEDEHEDNESSTYTLSTGNIGLVLINQMTDYIHRGDALVNMCLWEYCARVYKKKFTDKDLKKHEKQARKGQSGRECEMVHRFSPNHPQSETHWQKVRIRGSSLIPTLSKLPPSSRKNKQRYQKCMLLLFKPFTTFEGLFNGISWEETYEDFLQVTQNKHYIENMEDFLQGIEEDEENDDGGEEELRDVMEPDDDDDASLLNGSDNTTLDLQTDNALKVIRTTSWLDESISNHRNMQPVENIVSVLPPSVSWKNDLDKQNQDKLDEHDDPEELTPPPFTTANNNAGDGVDIHFSMVAIQEERDEIEQMRLDIIQAYTLNKKQTKAFQIATENVIKRHFKDETVQLIGYIGGPGGTGKSQLIKAIIEFHQRMKVRHTLKLCANTGTAAKHIGGSTTHTLFNFSSNKNKNDNQKLQKKFEKVKTIIVDEVSMIGCRQLLKIHTALCKGKCVPSSLPFGGVDILFFGDFIQFPPVKDTPLFYSWSKKKSKSKSKQSEINKNLGAHLWKQINTIILLDEQMRCTDPVYLDLLNRLREGKCTYTDAALLNTRVVGANFDLTSIIDAPIIVPGNQLVMAINDLFIGGYTHLTKVYVSKAYDYVGRKKNGKTIPKKVADQIKNLPSTSTGGLPTQLKLFIGMPVMVTNNIATELGITNGTVGKIRSIHFKNGEEVESEETGYQHIKDPPEYIIVELEEIDMKPLHGLPPNHVPISVRTESFSVPLPGKQKSGKQNSMNINRSHFPLVPRYSCTCHKSQGQTLKKAIVDLIPRSGQVVGIEFSYVPLSRVRRLQDLTILRPFNPSILNAKISDGCAEMMEEFKERDMCKDM